MTGLHTLEHLVTALRCDDIELLGAPVIAVDLDQGCDSDQLVELAATAVGALRVLIGLAAAPITGPDTLLAAAFDVLVCEAQEPPSPWVSATDFTDLTVGHGVDLVAELAAAVVTSPGAAITLSQLLRSGEALDAGDALVAESWVYSLLQTGPRYAEWLTERTRRTSRPEPTGDVVHLERREDTLCITLDRPEVRNAFSARLRDELVAALELVALDPTIERVELRGRGLAFSSGGDLGEFGTAPDPITAHLIRTSRSVGLGLHRHADRITSYVHGTCVGAGVELPAFTGTVIAHPGTSFRLPEVAMGVVPGAGGTSSIPRRIGRHRTAALALSGLLIDASTALRWGLVDQIDADAFRNDRESTDA
jgi:enoyl-CoA hydratase/carnithine racemase